MVTGEADREGCSPEMTVLEMADSLKPPAGNSAATQVSGLSSPHFQCQNLRIMSRPLVEKMRALVDQQPTLTEIPRAQRRALTRALSDFAREHERDEAIALAYLSGQHKMVAIAEHFGVHCTTVSRLMKVCEESQKAGM